MKVLLINSLPGNDRSILTDRYIPPLGLLYIAAYLRKHNHQVSLIDPLPMRMDDNSIKAFCLDSQPQLVGINAVTISINNAARIAGIIKKVSSARIIVGGPHASALPRETLLQFPVFDFICIGEGEVTMAELAQNDDYQKTRLQQIKGLAFRDCGDVCLTGPRDFIANLDNLPLPARDLIDISAYGSMLSSFFSRKGPATTILTSRGCPYRCSFCTSHVVSGNVLRTHSPNYVVEEIRHLKNTFGINNVVFIDDAFTLDQKRLKEICDLIITAGLNINWACQARADTVSFELMLKMKEAGCGLIFVGIESADPLILKEMKKGISVAQARQAVTIINKAGIKTMGNFILGNPRETKNSINQAVNFAISSNLFLTTFGFLSLLPGSDNYKDFIKNNYSADINWDTFRFENSTVYQKFPELTPGIDTCILKKYIFLAYVRFYLRPIEILRILKGITSWPKFIKKITHLIFVIVTKGFSD